MRVSKKYILQAVLLISFKVLLDVLYINYVSVQYNYSGFSLNLNNLKLVESYLLMLVIYFLFSIKDNRISGLVLKFLFLFMIVPTLSLYALKDEDRIFVYAIILSFFITMILTRIPYIKVPRLKNSKKILLFIIPLFTITTYIVLIRYNGMPTLQALDFSEIYDLRSETTYGPAFMNYFVVWQAKVINLFIIGIGLVKKNSKFIVIGISLQLILFLITGHKNYLFSPILLFIIVYAINRGKFLIVLLSGLISVLLVSAFTFFVNGSGTLASLFIRRVFFVPAQNVFLYHDFFSRESFVYLSHSIMSPFISYGYHLSPQHLIGLNYFNSSGMWANGGYLADAYMNFGFFGMFSFSVLLGFVLLFLDSLTIKIDKVIVISATAISLQSLINGALLTSLLTGGLIFGLILLTLYASSINENNHSKEKKGYT